MECTIRVANLDDLEKIQELNRLLFAKEKEEFDELLDMDWTFGEEGTDFFKKSLSRDDKCGFIAMVDGNIVGYLVGGLTKFESYRKMPGNVAELDNMLVLEEHRRCGAGTKLWDAFLSWCKTKDVKIVRVNADARNVAAINFYKKHGFTDYASIMELNL